MFAPKQIRCKMATDMMDARCDGLYGLKYCQVFGNRMMFAEAYPITHKKDCGNALKQFLREYGAPDVMITDGSKEQTKPGTAFQSILRKNNVWSVNTPPHRPNYNPAETIIRELRKR